jgi:hypothetical protein
MHVPSGTAYFPISPVPAIDYYHHRGQPDIRQQELDRAGLPGRGESATATSASTAEDAAAAAPYDELCKVGRLEAKGI